MLREEAIRPVEDLARELSPFGFQPTFLTESDQDALTAGLTRWSNQWKAEGGHGPAVVIWSGHGKIAPSGELQLITRPTWDPAVHEDRFSAQHLTDWALSGRADQTLILLDICQTGSGIAASALNQALNSMITQTSPNSRKAWVGVLAASRSHERGDDTPGHLLDTVRRVLRDGPERNRDGLLLHEWSVRNKDISGEALARGVMADWPGDDETLVRVSRGLPEPIFPNPLWRPDAGKDLTDHLLLASRGVDPTEEGWFFTGRLRVMREITTWLATGRTGLLLLTGSAGSGKSAIAGRIASLADPRERREVLHHTPPTVDDPDPGEGSVDAALHLRGMRVMDVAEALAERLGLAAPPTPAGLIAELEALEADGAGRRVLVLDGLDEAAPDQAVPIVQQLLVPLSRLCAVLLASRARPFQPHIVSAEPLDAELSRAIGARVQVIDLDEETNTAEDIAAYIHRRLLAVGIPEDTAAKTARTLAERAVASSGGFLFAHIVTSAMVRQHTADLSRPARARIPESIADALALDLASGATRVRDDGVVLPHAASDLLTALAWSAGNGMPAHGVWEKAGEAISREGTVYHPADIDWLLRQYGRYIVEDSDKEQAVYRLYHRELIEHLRRGIGALRSAEEGTRDAEAVVQTLVELVLRQTGDGEHLEDANTYLLRHLPDHAVLAGGRGIAALRRLAEINSAAFLPLLATALLSLSVRLGESGLSEAGVDPGHEAVRIYRWLADKHATAYLPDLATSLNNLAVRLAENGLLSEAMGPAEEAVAIRRELANTNPTAHLPDLATSLNNLAVRLAENGLLSEAMDPAEEAVAIRRELANTNPTAHLPDLATSLNNLANRLAGIGRRQEAVAPAAEAVSLCRVLAESNPTAYVPGLASSLNNLAVQLAETGSRDEALGLSEEAVHIRRELAATNPTAHLPDLATSLDNLAVRLAECGRRDEAAFRGAEAVRIRRELAATNPAVYRPALASSLNNLAVQLAETGSRDEALGLSEEAVHIRRELAATNPTAHLPDLAASLSNLANRLADVGLRQEAMAPAEEALRIHRELTAAHPTAFLPDLATSLNTLAVLRTRTGRLPEAMDLSEEAVAIRRQLSADNPAHLSHLAASLNNLANRMADVGRLQDAVNMAEEAVTIRRRLYEQNPDAHLPHLATSLNNLAVQKAKARQLPEALALAEEAVDIHRALSRQNPTAYHPDLATSLNNLAVQKAKARQLPEALALAEEAVDIH
ncbi:tetratricopeptide repeat protein, partial [Streptomyces sp. NPDC048256]|uniref:tetratricopeptide repeat protein n=1 Tax=Streptomyces sp. NPDC048256 TaxID=3154613 RepID=UPI0033DE2390